MPTVVVSVSPPVGGGRAPQRQRQARALNGLLISRAAAEVLLGVIDQLALQCAPKVLGLQVIALRADLLESCTYADTSVDVSAEVDSDADVLSFDVNAVIDSKAAADRLGIGEAGVRYLCREGLLVATQIAGRWWIDPASVDDYQPRDGRRGR